MLLKNKTAVIYGGGGAVGSAVAKAFAREGAHVFLAGRTLSRLRDVADEIAASGDLVEFDRVDAADQKSVDDHLNKIIENKGSIDISFNLISLQDIHGAPLTSMVRDQFITPVTLGLNAHFTTATAAARHMMKKRSGVILALTANASRNRTLIRVVSE
jgi:NAD(P)-dependent dehydrogenase (short-subunit alcohol dehydrogenase family)